MAPYIKKDIKKFELIKLIFKYYFDILINKERNKIRLNEYDGKKRNILFKINLLELYEYLKENIDYKLDYKKMIYAVKSLDNYDYIKYFGRLDKRKKCIQFYIRQYYNSLICDYIRKDKDKIINKRDLYDITTSDDYFCDITSYKRKNENIKNLIHHNPYWDEKRDKHPYLIEAIDEYDNKDELYNIIAYYFWEGNQGRFIILDETRERLEKETHKCFYHAGLLY